jgi:hypothetical protein
VPHATFPLDRQTISVFEITERIGLIVFSQCLKETASHLCAIKTWRVPELILAPNGNDLEFPKSFS